MTSSEERIHSILSRPHAFRVDGEEIGPPSTILWINPEMDVCPESGCSRIDTPEALEKHMELMHPTTSGELKDEMREEILAREVQRLNVPSDMVRCPFCLSMSNMREMCFLLPSGRLSLMRKCNFCEKVMQAKNASMFMRGPVGFAQGILEYGAADFWSVVEIGGREKWMKTFNQIGATGRFDVQAFWTEYRRLKPKREDAEKQMQDERRTITSPAEEKLQATWRKKREEEKRQAVADANVKLSSD